VIAYFDTSAFVKLLVSEPGSDEAVRVWGTAGVLVASTLLYPEVRAAVARARRDDRLSSRGAKETVALVHDLVDHIGFVAATDSLLWRAGDLADKHGLRGFDAVHLASAAHVGPDTTLVTADFAMATAARAEGMAVLVPA
jgi:predicted nucleic acid-binding protein